VLLANAAHLRRTRRQPGPPPRLPRVSVLIPARDEAENIARLIPSLLAQAYPDFEVIVYDDDSTDGTGRIAGELGGDRVTVVRGEGPPAGWVGKVHALHQAAQRASGEILLFLDADAELRHRDALRSLVARWLLAEGASGGRGGVVTGLPRLAGGGELLVSLVPFALNIGLPMALVPRTRLASLASLNGQCWMIGAEAYRAHEPHAAMPDEVLEDVMIGRYLKRRGMRLELHDLGEEVCVHMYEDHGAAWAGFRKNVYLLQSGTVAGFLAIQGVFLMAFIAAPLLSGWLLFSAWLMKAVSDRLAGFDWQVPAMAPLSLLMGAVLPFDSAVSHWRGRVAWKGRNVGAAAP
jgi:glycosyltransferase involved in cell wall biosynthesis